MAQSTDKTLSNLIINRMPQSVYDAKKAAGELSDDELYLTPSTSGREWELIHQGSVGADGVSSYQISKDANGNDFALKKFDFEILSTTFWFQGDGLNLNGFTKGHFTTNNATYNGDSYLSGVQAVPTDYDSTKPCWLRLRWIGEIQNGGVLQMISFGYQIYTDTEGVVRVNNYGAGSWGQRQLNMIISKGALFPNGLTSCGYAAFYNGFKNAQVTLKGVRT